MGVALGLLFGAGFAMVLSGFKISVPHVKSPAPAIQRFSFAPFIDDMASAVRAGMNAPEAMWQAASHLPATYALIFEDAKVLWMARGFEAALLHVRHCCPDRDLHHLVEVLNVVRTTGSQTLATSLSHLARMTRTRQELLNEVRGRQAVTVTSARVAVAAPWLVLLLTSGRPQTRSTFLSSSGLFVLLAVAILCTVSYVAMQKMSRIEDLEYAT